MTYTLLKRDVEKCLRCAGTPLTPKAIKRRLQLSDGDCRVNAVLSKLKKAGDVISAPNPESTHVGGKPEHLWSWNNGRPILPNESLSGPVELPAVSPVPDPTPGTVRDLAPRPHEPQAPVEPLSTAEMMLPPIDAIRAANQRAATCAPSAAELLDLLDRADPEFLALYMELRQGRDVARNKVNEVRRNLELVRAEVRRLEDRLADAESELEAAQGELIECARVLS